MSRIVKRLTWYKNRLAAMSGAEILYRVNEAAKRKADRLNSQRFVPPPSRDYGALPEIPGLRSGVEAWAVPSQLLHQWTQDAHQAQDGKHILLNYAWPDSTGDDAWHLDPFSGQQWPRDRYCFSIDYRHAHGMGDVKFVWELNRLQFLQPIAALACKRKDAGLAKFCLDSLESWIDSNPPFDGVNWSSGIELTLRILSILVLTTLTGEHLTRGQRGKIWATLETHGRWLARHPSRHSSANNHRAAEGLGLFVVGALCPHFAHAAEWRQKGWDILREVARLQILPDGGGAEQTVAYTAFVLEMLLTGLIVARAMNVSVPAVYIYKITMGGEYLRWLTDKNGNQPHIGDDDNACLFGAYHADDDYVSSLLGCIAAVTGRADLTPPMLRPHLRQALFGFAPAPDFNPQGLRCFPHSGLAVGRHNSTNGEIMLAFDYGYLGYLSIAAHGHADALALWLHIDGQPVFVDAGTYLYHAQEQERSLFRSTAMHNTLVLERQNSSIMAGNFNWSEKAQTILRETVSRGDFWQVSAEHDGYAKNFDARHRRTLSVSPATGAVVEDEVIAALPHTVEIGFLLHPDLTARQEGHEVVILKGEKQLLCMRHEGELTTTIGFPRTAQGGWYSPGFAIKQATTRIIFSGTMRPGQKASTHLFWAY